jgi:hypothetical protein
MKYHGIPWNFMKFDGTSQNPAEPHGIPQNLMEFHERFWNMAKL